MRNITICLIMLFMALPSVAVQENLTVGPYKLSFDMGLPKGAYDVEIADPKPQESLSGHLSTEYLINISDGSDRRGYIEVARYEDKLVVPTIDELIEDLRDALPYSLSNVEVVGREIDETVGAAASGRNYFSEEDNYFAIYYLSSQETVKIMSKYPWEEGTLALLKTIRVERNSTEMPDIGFVEN